MPLYRKKPVVIEAWQWNGRLDVKPDWLIVAANDPKESVVIVGTGCVVRQRDKLLIGTLEGTMTASLTDWIIRGVKGEIYPCRKDIFESTYEKVED